MTPTSNDHTKKNFRPNSRSREFFLFLIFFAVSAAFWLLQALNEPYETDIQIPLRLENVPEEAIITDEPPKTLTVSVRDKGNSLILYYFGKRPRPIVLDFMKYHSNGNYTRITSAELEKHIKNRLLSSTTLLSIKPNTVEYYYSIGERRMLPVHLNLKVRTEREYVATDTLLTPDSVLAFAPTHILKQLKEAETTTAIFNHIKDTVHSTIAFKPIKGVKFVPASVQVRIPVDLLTEKSVEVPIIGTGFPAGTQLRTFPSRIKVRFLVAFHQFKQVREQDFRIEVPYSEVAHSNQTKCRPRITMAPSNIFHLQMEPPTVEFLIEHTKNEP